MPRKPHYAPHEIKQPEVKVEVAWVFANMSRERLLGQPPSAGSESFLTWAQFHQKEKLQVKAPKITAITGRCFRFTIYGRWETRFQLFSLRVQRLQRATESLP